MFKERLEIVSEKTSVYDLSGSQSEADERDIFYDQRMKYEELEEKIEKPVKEKKRKKKIELKRVTTK
jgi:hypothetical protein